LTSVDASPQSPLPGELAAAFKGREGRDGRGMVGKKTEGGEGKERMGGEERKGGRKG